MEAELMCDDKMHEKMDALHKRFDDHIKDEAVERRELMNAIHGNQEAIAKVANSVEGVVNVYDDIQGTVRVGKGVQNFMVWLLKWGAIGTALAAGLKYIIDHIPK